MDLAKTLVLAAVSSAYATVSFAQDSSTSPRPPLDPQRRSSIDSFITTQMVHQKIPGLAVGIYSRGQTLLVKAMVKPTSNSAYRSSRKPSFNPVLWVNNSFRHPS
jgi:hypothetical protein